MNADFNDLSLLRSLLTLASVIEARDPYTGGHIWRVGKYAKALAEKAGLEKDLVFRAELGGLVHDLGKVGVSDSILRKEGKLTDGEYASIKKHPEIGRSLIYAHPLAPLVMDAVFSHHERVDGKGYPGGLREEKVPLLAGLVAVADAFDAMTSTRSYHVRMDQEKAWQIIEAGRGRQFNDALAGVFLDLGRKGGLSHIIEHCGDERLMLCCPKCGPIIAPPSGTKDGDCLSCPSCTGEFLLHAGGRTFELEPTGRLNPVQYPKPDTDTIEAFVSSVGG
ncbi:MAG: HD domain-containing protein [Elusimicrobia bacterium]|nr:HD domain-containing protein [Elusimicrobiota bacterium]